MVLYEGEILIATAGERPTHGYQLGQILFDSGENQFYELTARNTHAWTAITNPTNVTKDITLEKYGTCTFNGMTIRGDGIMSDIQPVGATMTPNGLDGSGSQTAIATGTAAIQNAGVVILRPVGSFAGFTRPNFFPSYKTRSSPPVRTGGDTRFYSGYHTTTSSFALAEEPIAQVDGGLVVGFNSTDVNFNIWHGDGTNPVTKVEMTSAPVPATITSFRFEIKFTSATVAVVTIYGGTTNIVLDTKTINTNLPAGAKSLNWSHVVQNPLQTNRSLAMYNAWMTMRQ